MELPKVGLIIILCNLLIAHRIVVVESAAPWPWRNSNNLSRLPNRSNWRKMNVLAMASNKSVCSGDFYFLLDSSSSIGDHVFSQMVKYVSLVLNMFSPSQVQYQDLNIGLVRFSSRTEILSKPLPPNDTTLMDTLAATTFYAGGQSSIVRAFRLMSIPSLWEREENGFKSSKAGSRFKKMAKSLFKGKRRRKLVVFTDGQFGDSEPEMALATLGICRQMAASVTFVGIKGWSSDLNIRNLAMLADSPQHLYLLGSIGSGLERANDELSAWNLAAYLCYSLQKRP